VAAVTGAFRLAELKAQLLKRPPRGA